MDIYHTYVSNVVHEDGRIGEAVQRRRLLLGASSGCAPSSVPCRSNESAVGGGSHINDTSSVTFDGGHVPQPDVEQS